MADIENKEKKEREVKEPEESCRPYQIDSLFERIGALPDAVYIGVLVEFLWVAYEMKLFALPAYNNMRKTLSFLLGTLHANPHVNPHSVVAYLNQNFLRVTGVVLKTMAIGMLLDILSKNFTRVVDQAIHAYYRDNQRRIQFACLQVVPLLEGHVRREPAYLIAAYVYSPSTICVFPLPFLTQEMELLCKIVRRRWREERKKALKLLKDSCSGGSDPSRDNDDDHDDSSAGSGSSSSSSSEEPVDDAMSPFDAVQHLLNAIRDRTDRTRDKM